MPKPRRGGPPAPPREESFARPYQAPRRPTPALRPSLGRCSRAIARQFTCLDRHANRSTSVLRRGCGACRMPAGPPPAARPADAGDPPATPDRRGGRDARASARAGEAVAGPGPAAARPAASPDAEAMVPRPDELATQEGRELVHGLPGAAVRGEPAQDVAAAAWRGSPGRGVHRGDRTGAGGEPADRQDRRRLRAWRPAAE